MKYLFKVLLILFFSFLNNLIAATEEVDEERYTSGGQWEVSSGDKGFIKYNEQEINLGIKSDDLLKDRSFFDQKDVTDAYQIHTVYILASDSKDKKFDVNGTIKKILEDSNNLLLKNTDKKFRLDLRENGELDISFLRVNKTKKEINRLDNAAGYFTGMAVLNGFHHPKKVYAIFYQDYYGREWGQVGDAIFTSPKGEVEMASGVTYLGFPDAPVKEAWIPNTHELFHALGFVQLCAPNAIVERGSNWGKNDHLNTMNDIMSDRGGDFYRIDQKRNQYYDHSNIGCEMDLKKSVFLEPTEDNFQLQPRSESCKLTRWQPQYKHDRSLDCMDRFNLD
jgi:hypothetical protein